VASPSAVNAHGNVQGAIRNIARGTAVSNMMADISVTRSVSPSTVTRFNTGDKPRLGAGGPPALSLGDISEKDKSQTAHSSGSI
jgi:hypothetical protein